MKKIVYFLLFALTFPIGIMAQNANDDLYFIPSKDKKESTPVKKVTPQRQVTNNIYTSPGTTVVIKDQNGKSRDIDEYNRRYDARDNDFAYENDTLYIDQRSQPALDGEWVSGEFNGSQDDYDYAERIIRFRNPRFAVSISSPLYWEMVYGANSWDWNVYNDGMYAYAFPTFSNSLWWDWRYNSFNSFGWGWNSGWGWGSGWGWNRPYYSMGYYPGYWGGWNGGYWGGGYWGGGYWGGGYWGGGYWGHNHGPSWGWGGGYRSPSTYTTRRNNAVNRYGTGSGRNSYTSTQSRRSGAGSSMNTTRRSVSGSSMNTTRRSEGSSTINNNRRSSSNSGRVVGNTSRTDGSSYVRDNSSSARRSTYTRPSSTRSSSGYDRSNSSRSSSSSGAYSTSRRSTPTYNRGSSTSPSSSRSDYGSSSRSSSTPSYNSSRSNSGSSYSSGSSSRSGGSYSSGSSSRSSGGGGSSSSRSSGGGSRR